MKTSGWIGRMGLAMAAAMLASSLAWAAPQPATFTATGTTGTVSVKNASGTKTLKKRDTVSAGDSIVTGSSDAADFAILSGDKTIAFLHLDDSTSLSLGETTVDTAGPVPIVKVSAKVDSGSISGNAPVSGSSFVVEAGGSKAEVNGTFSAKADGTVYCFSGTVSVTTSTGKSFTLVAGQSYDSSVAAVLPHSLPPPTTVAGSSGPATTPPPTVQVVSPTQPGGN